MEAIFRKEPLFVSNWLLEIILHMLGLVFLSYLTFECKMEPERSTEGFGNADLSGLFHCELHPVGNSTFRKSPVGLSH